MHRPSVFNQVNQLTTKIQDTEAYGEELLATVQRLNSPHFEQLIKKLEDVLSDLADASLEATRARQIERQVRKS